MFIAHVPAGYLGTKAVLRGIPKQDTKENIRLWIWGLTASVLPDMDIIYFYLIDNRQHLHHSYWTHLPVFWMAIFFVLLSYGKIQKKIQFVRYVRIGALNILIHLILDSMAGSIRWMAPFSSHGFSLVKIPVKYNWWVLNYILNVSFGIELLIVGVAFYALIKRVPRDSWRFIYNTGIKTKGTP